MNFGFRDCRQEPMAVSLTVPHSFTTCDMSCFRKDDPGRTSVRCFVGTMKRDKGENYRTNARIETRLIIVITVQDHTIVRA